MKTIYSTIQVKLLGVTECLVCLLVFGLVPTLVLADARLCPGSQTVELGGPGYILCNLPEDFYEVYWFDNISDSSHCRILYKPNEGVKSGPGFDRGEYDVQEDDGSLIITNVTIWHERMYKVLVFKQSSLQPDNQTISLRVTASPNHDSPIIGCQNCYDGYYHRLVEGETLSCSFGAARPPVQLEWFYQSGDGYDHVEMQSFNITENGNGTYNSLATFQSLNDLTHSLVCRATWPAADWRREKEVLVDFSTNESFSDIEPETQYMELNRYTLIPCRGLSSSYMIWKKIIPSDNPELVGFHSHIMTRTITSDLDIEVSIDDGSLTFLSVGVHNEGMYACISGDGLNEEIHLTSVKILILPSPLYVNITGCDDVFQGCRLSENTTKVLECAVRGVRPAATLEWIAEDKNQISFFNHSMVSKENNDTFDTILSVEYEVSQDVLCGEEIFVQCNPHEPLSELIEAEATAFIIPVSCKEKEAADSGLLSSGTLIFIFWTVYSVYRMFYFIFLLWQSRKGNKKGNKKTTNSRVAFVADIVVQVITKFILGEVFYVALLVWFWLSRKAYGITTLEIVLFIAWIVFSTVSLVFRIVLFVWRSCKGFKETAKSRVVSVADKVILVLNIIEDVFFVAVMVWFWSFWTAGITLWEIVLFTFLIVSAVIHMFCKLWMFRLSCKRNEKTANSKAGIVNRVILIISKEVWHLMYSVWFLSFFEASDSGLTPWEIVLFILLTVWSVLRTVRAVCLLWQSWKGNKQTADRVLYAYILRCVKNSLQDVLFLAVSVWFWSLWKESEETALKGLIIVSLVFQPVILVINVYWFCRNLVRERARRRRTQNAELDVQRLIKSHLEEVKRIHKESMRRTESAPSLSLLNAEGNGQPTEHAERFTLQNAEELVIQRRERRKHQELMRIFEILQYIESAESPSWLNVEELAMQTQMPQFEEFTRISMGSMRLTESAPNLSLLNVEGNGQSTEHAERFTLQDAEALAMQRRLLRQLEESMRMLEIMQQIESAAESSSLLNDEGNGQPTEQAESLPLQEAEGNSELEPTENAERIPLQNVQELARTLGDLMLMMSMEIMQQIESDPEMSSLLNFKGNGQPTEQAESFLLQVAEGNSELEPTENAERIPLQNVEGNGELASTENAARTLVVAEVHTENEQSVEHAGRLPLQNAEGNGELKPTENAERLPVVNVQVHRENGQTLEHAEKLPFLNAEGNDEKEHTENAERIPLLNDEGNGEQSENAERIPLQNVEGNRRSIELC